MGKSNLDIILGLQDHTSALGGVIGKLQSIGKIAITGAVVGIAAVGAGVVAMASQAIPAASNLNEALNASNVVFGEAASKIQEFGKIAAETTGLSATAFNQMAAETGSMLINYGLNADTAAGETINLTQRAADMASIFNTDVSEALAAIQSGLRGEANPLERFGVSMNAAMVEAKALELGMAKTNGQFTNAQLTQARLALLYEQTNSIAGDFVNTSDGLANAARIQQARWGNFLADVGTKFLPIVQKFQGIFMSIGEKVMPIVLNAIGPVADRLGVFADKLGIVFEAIQAGGIGALFTSFEDGSNRIGGLIAAFGISKEKAYAFGETINKVANWIGGVLVPFLRDQLFPWLSVNIPIALQTLANFWTNTLQPAIVVVWNWMSTVLIPFLTGVLIPWLSVNIPIALQTLANFWTNTLQPAIAVVWGWISTVLIPFLQNVLFPWLAVNIPKAISTLSNFWTQTLWPAIQKVWSFIQTYVLPILTKLGQLVGVLLVGYVGSLAKFFTTVLIPAIKKIWEWLNNNLVPIFKDLWDWLGKVTGGFDGISKAIDSVIGWIGSLITKLTGITLPDWLMPGSPTPFELGLIGIGQAMKDLNRLALPQLSVGLAGLPTGLTPVGSTVSGSGGGLSIGQVIINAQPGQDGAALYRQFKAELENDLRAQRNLGLGTARL